MIPFDTVAEKVGPEVLRVYAAALEHRRRFGEEPSANVVIALAEAEGASVGACLVLARYELFTEDGRLIPLDGSIGRGPVLAHDAQTLWAILSRGAPAAWLKAPQGFRIPKRGIEECARAWDLQAGMAARYGPG